MADIPHWFTVASRIETELWAAWDQLITEECAGCGASQAMELIEPILREEIGG